MKQSTSWNQVAHWYEGLLQNKHTYQKELILPNLVSRMEIQKGETILDVACGEGFFAREFYKHGAHVIGADISDKLIEIAKRKLQELTLSPKRRIEFFVSPASRLHFLKNESMDKITLIMALQNIENVKEVFYECARVLKQKGKIFIVMTHPAFRVPKASFWQWDEKQKIQYRRLDQYLSQSQVNIEMHPGLKTSEKTITFHRPLQFYFKALKKNQLFVYDLEEWISNKISVQGPRAQAENRAREEFPLFLYLAAKKFPQ